MIDSDYRTSLIGAGRGARTIMEDAPPPELRKIDPPKAGKWVPLPSGCALAELVERKAGRQGLVEFDVQTSEVRLSDEKGMAVFYGLVASVAEKWR